MSNQNPDPYGPNTYGYGQQYPNPQFVAPPAPAPVNPEKNGFGIAAVILGPIGLFFCLMPITGWLGVILGLTGFILAIAGLARVSRGKATNKWTSVTGLVFCILSIFAGIAVTIVFFTIVDDAGKDLNRFSDCIDNATTAQQIDACS